jgi:hypothetical protein
LLRRSLWLLLGVSAALTLSCALVQLYRQETPHEAKLRAS